MTFYEVKKKKKYMYLFKKEAEIIVKAEQVVLVLQRQVLQNIYMSHYLKTETVFLTEGM